MRKGANMSGKERVWGVLAGRPVDPLPVMPIIHTALAGYAGVPLGRYFTDARLMADVAVWAAERVTLRGNLDPIATFFTGSAEKVHTATRDLVQQAAGTKWILSSGCDIPVGTKIENMQAFVTGATGRYFRTSPR